MADKKLQANVMFIYSIDRILCEHVQIAIFANKLFVSYNLVLQQDAGILYCSVEFVPKATT